MTTALPLVAACDRCRRYRCRDRRSCDEAYIAVLEERVHHWQQVARVFHERARLESQSWPELRRGGRGRPMPGELS